MQISSQNDGKNLKNPKILLIFLKICTFWKNGDFVKNILGKNLIFFSFDFDNF